MSIFGEKEKNLISMSLYNFFTVGCRMELLENTTVSEVVKEN